MFSTVFPIKGSWCRGRSFSLVRESRRQMRLISLPPTIAKENAGPFRSRSIVYRRFLNTFRQLGGGTFNFLPDRGKLDTRRPNSQKKPAVSPRDQGKILPPSVIILPAQILSLDAYYSLLINHLYSLKLSFNQF